MMSKEKRRVPKLRFPGFTEDWEQRKLNEFLSVSNLKNTENKYNKKDVLSVSGDYGIVNQIEFQGRSFAGVSVSNYGVVEKGDIVYTKSPLKLNPYGIIKTNRINNGIVSTLYAIYKTKENCDSKFIEHYFNLDSRLNQYLKPLVNKGAKNDMKVSSENALVGEVCFPQITEQAMIADLLDRLDIYITLHQRKLDNLKLKKKTLLQKLFPKNGERYPELRFPGFTDAWEQRKLSDVLVERNEQQVETREYPLMSFVQGLGVTPKGERYDRSFLVLDQSKKYKRTELGDFIYSSNNLETGSIGINKTGKAVISPVYSIFQGVSIGDSQFIGIMSLLPRFIAKMIRFRQGVVYGQWRIHETDFLDISVLIPSVDERTKITQLILSIEELITLHQRKLDHLQLQKKALLQQMFV